jgi:hypothetical protein
VRFLRRVFACVLVLLLIGESSGIARAFGPGATVHCCCGDHTSARPCPCPDCPVLRVRGHHHDGDAEARLAAGRDCSGGSADDPGILTVVAVAIVSLAVPVPSLRDTLTFAPPRSLRDRTVDAARPPP